MKANEAPERLYLHPTSKGKVGASWLTFPLTNEDIEYTRTDAFIKKAADYIKRHSALLDSDGNDCMPEWIENFKKAMKL